MAPNHSIILAAGKGVRMHSNRAKVLHQLAGKSLIEHVVETANKVSDTVHIVCGHQADELKNCLTNTNNASNARINWAFQKQQNGTADAVLTALPAIKEDAANVLVLYGDVPLIQPNTLLKLRQASQQNGIAILTAILDNPNGYGRIIRDDSGKGKGEVTRIVEDKDASDDERQINEINSGIMAISLPLLKKYLANITTNNTQQEYYLTDIVALAVADGTPVAAMVCDNRYEIAGVNDKSQLLALEHLHQQQHIERLITNGLLIKDANRFDIRGELQFGMDCVVDINVIIEGEVRLGNNVSIGANCCIKNSTIGDGSTIKENTIIDGSQIDTNVSVGPFARIRPECVLKDNSCVGNFVEVKKSILGERSKVNHLSYIGDAHIGSNVNIGAGVITCNYDGVRKNTTLIKDNAFIGSNCALVAPVSIGKNATIGAGSTITKDVPDNKLTLSRNRQTTVENWHKRDPS